MLELRHEAAARYASRFRARKVREMSCKWLRTTARSSTRSHLQCEWQHGVACHTCSVPGYTATNVLRRGCSTQLRALATVMGRRAAAQIAAKLESQTVEGINIASSQRTEQRTLQGVMRLYSPPPPKSNVEATGNLTPPPDGTNIASQHWIVGGKGVVKSVKCWLWKQQRKSTFGLPGCNI